MEQQIAASVEREDATADDIEPPWSRARERTERPKPRLVLAWSFDEPERVGECVVIDRKLAIGRGAPLADDPAPRATFERVRQGARTQVPPLAAARVSRLQLLVEPRGDDAIYVRNVGRCVLRHNGRETTETVAREGDVLELHHAVVFYVASGVLPRSGQASNKLAPFPFGAPDAFDFVGESPSAWALRESVTVAADTDRHVLVLGESGVGKELAARALHGLSTRATRAFVARNAATLPETLVDAELFGNVKNFPNVGSPERPGLLGEAHESTLFLDEIGDLPEPLQVHLLRALDRDGEYQRLGESKPRRSSFRLVAATNRPTASLKHDFLARFTHRIEIPGLGARKEDIPLLLARMLERIAEEAPTLADRFFEKRYGERAEARVTPRLVSALLRHRFTHHVRELERITWLAVTSASDDWLDLTAAVERELSVESEPESSEIDRDTLVRVLAESAGSATRAARALGLKNRFALYRLLKKHGIDAAEGEEDS